MENHRCSGGERAREDGARGAEEVEVEAEVEEFVP
jgi:hypothetical protein